MARLQILELPEGSGDDRPPFVLVVDQYLPQRYIMGADHDPEPINEFDGIAEQIGARAVLVFAETIDIPANDLPSSGDEIEVSDTDFTEMATSVHRALGIDMAQAGVKPDIAGWLLTACRELEKSEIARASLNQHKVALLDALGMDRTRDWDDIRNAAAGVLKQRGAQGEAIERVRRLHHPVEHSGVTICAACSGWDGSTTDNSPCGYEHCPTLKALAAEQPAADA